MKLSLSRILKENKEFEKEIQILSQAKDIAYDVYDEIKKLLGKLEFSMVVTPQELQIASKKKRQMYESYKKWGQGHGLRRILNKVPPE